MKIISVTGCVTATIEFLSTWELMHNPAFKGVEFDTFLHEAGAPRFNMTPRPVAMYRQTMPGSQLSRLNSIEMEKGFRKLGASAGNKGLKPAPGTEE